MIYRQNAEIFPYHLLSIIFCSYIHIYKQLILHCMSPYNPSITFKCVFYRTLRNLWYSCYIDLPYFYRFLIVFQVNGCSMDLSGNICLIWPVKYFYFGFLYIYIKKPKIFEKKNTAKIGFCYTKRVTSIIKSHKKKV